MSAEQEARARHKAEGHAEYFGSCGEPACVAIRATEPGTPQTASGRPRCSWCNRKVPRENHRPNCPRPDERYSAFDLAEARAARDAEVDRLRHHIVQASTHLAARDVLAAHRELEAAILDADTPS